MFVSPLVAFFFCVCAMCAGAVVAGSGDCDGSGGGSGSVDSFFSIIPFTHSALIARRV